MLRFEKLEAGTMLNGRPMPDSETLWQTPTHGQWYEANPTYIDSYDDTSDRQFSSPKHSEWIAG